MALPTPFSADAGSRIGGPALSTADRPEAAVAGPACSWWGLGRETRPATRFGFGLLGHLGFLQGSQCFLGYLPFHQTERCFANGSPRLRIGAMTQ